MKWIRAADTALLRREGTGPTLVLLHGIGSNAESWRPMVSALPHDADVVAWWAPGYGDSRPVRPERPTPADYAARLAQVLDGLSLDRVALVGHSLGCLFAGAFALAHPDRVAALALLSPALGYGVAPGAALPPGVQARIDDLAELGPRAFAAKRAGRLVHRPESLPAVREAMSAVNLPGYAQAVHALGAGDLLRDAKRLPPALVACGEFDAITPPSNACALHAALPASTLHIVPEAGHALPQDQPGAVAALLAGMLAHV
ncbi:alpha/beta fold hydrolase [Falsiroseomonas sp. HW251]|uniref:alpha/beta fold hydrolase n=1 Tax=Falsiroseomonas sp. HW251 TaxID=3390998 RepID=UPI003D317709